MNQIELLRKYIDLINEACRYTPETYARDTKQKVDEVAPKGWEGTVKAMKKHPKIDNPWALAHYMKNKGYKSHKKAKEDVAIAEKWGESGVVNPKEKGKYEGKTKSELQKSYNALKKSGPHHKGSPEYGKMRELAFAIRAKSGWGKVGEE